MLRLDALNADREMVPVNILMDDGSDSTLIREGLTRRLRLTGQRQTLFVGGVGEESSVHENSEYLELQLRTSAGETVSIQGSTIPSITKPVHDVCDGMGETTRTMKPHGTLAAASRLWWTCGHIDWLGPCRTHHCE
jgi:hypothetical protein